MRKKKLKTNHDTLLYHHFQWLPVSTQIQHKINSISYKWIPKPTPTGPSDCLYTPSRTLHSSAETPTFKILPHHQVLNNQASKHTLKQRRHHYQYHYFPSCSKHLRKGTCTKATGISPLLPFPHQTIKQQSPPSLFRSCKEAEKLHLTQNKIFCCNS